MIPRDAPTRFARQTQGRARPPRSKSPRCRWRKEVIHKRYRRALAKAVSRHTESMFLSPVRFALRTLPLRWEGTIERIALSGKVKKAFQKGVAKKAACRRGKGSGIHLLCKQISAERDPAAQHDGGEVGTLAALEIRPALNGGNQSGKSRANHAENPKVSSDSLDLATFFGTFRAEVQKLDNAQEVVRRSAASDAGNFAHFLGQRFFRRRTD